MLDLNFIAENPDEVKQGMNNKGYDSTIVDELTPHIHKYQTLQAELLRLRTKRNEISARGPEASDEGRQVKHEIDAIETDYNQVWKTVEELWQKIPNLPSTDTPIGAGESSNRITKTWGEKPPISNPLDHLTLGERYDLFDIPRATKISGTRFGFIKNQAVLIELALVRFALDIATKHGFKPMIPPQLVNQKTVMGTGYLPHGADEVYKTQDDLYLIGTSEIALVAYHADEVLTKHDLPIRYAGLSTCFRREAGSYGKDTKGILRQHQFDKVELVSIVEPENSNSELELILSVEEEIMQTLNLPYQIVQIGSGDLGVQAAKKFDIETWIPSQDKYRETHSCSNTTDYQARRLKIRYKTDNGENVLVHTINGTAVAIGRMLIAIIENGQQVDGSIRIPSALMPYLGFDQIS